MKNFVIPPVSDLELYKLGSAGFFALGQLCRKYPHYKQFVKNLVAEGVYVILDSGIGDHNPITQEELFELTLELKPAEVIPLDTLFNAEQTIVNMIQFLKLVKEAELKINIMGCPQGINVKEWMMCYDYFLQNEDVNVIGMSKLSIPNVFGFETDDSSIKEARHMMIALLQGSGRLIKPLHFLGMGNPNEFRDYKIFSKQKEIFRSTDSCNTILSAMNGYDWSEQNFTRQKTPLDYFEREVSQEAKELAEKNANYFQLILEGTTNE